MAIEKNILGVDQQGIGELPLAQARFSHLGKKRKAAPKKETSKPVISEAEKQKRQEKKAEQEQSRAKERRCISVGLDFGTTYSGAAIVPSFNLAQDVRVITDWTGGQCEIYEKVPTRIAYATVNDFKGDKFGYGVSPGMVSCQWFKLLLDSSVEPSAFDDPLLQRALGEGSGKLMFLPDGKTVEDVVSDWLEWMRTHVLDVLARRMGPANLKEMPILWTLTTPATWSPSAREKTRAAAIRAGFEGRERDRMAMIDEPEAAGIAAMKGTLDTFEEKSPFQGSSIKSSSCLSQLILEQKSMCVLTVDIGGGTVDLVVHKIVKLDPLKLEEACVGEALDRGFHQLLTSKFGTHFTDLPLERVGAGSLLMKLFEEVKRDFKGTDNEDEVYKFQERLVGLDKDDKGNAKSYAFTTDEILVTSAEIEKLFEPVLEKTKQLVSRQLGAAREAGMPAIKTILLVGGMASSPYLQDNFKEYVVQELDRDDIEVVIPERAWSAIARGAAIRGLECEKAPILFRRARDNIGIVVHEKWDPVKHETQECTTCPLHGPRAKNQMRWHIIRGEKIKPSLKKYIDCYAMVKTPAGRESVKVYQDLFSCRLREAPTKKDETVSRIGTIRMDLTKTMGEERKKLRKAGSGTAIGVKVKVPIRIQIELGSTKGMFLVTAKVGRKSVGTEVIECHSDPNWREEAVVENEEAVEVGSEVPNENEAVEEDSDVMEEEW